MWTDRWRGVPSFAGGPTARRLPWIGRTNLSSLWPPTRQLAELADRISNGRTLRPHDVHLTQLRDQLLRLVSLARIQSCSGVNPYFESDHFNGGGEAHPPEGDIAWCRSASSVVTAADTRCHFIARSSCRGSPKALACSALTPTLVDNEGAPYIFLMAILPQ